MKNLIRKILKEELSDDDLNWIQEIDPIDTFKEWAESQSTRHGFKDLTDRHWLHLTEDTKAFMQEFTNDTHYLLEYVENLNSSAGLQHTFDMLVEIQNMLGDEDGQSDNYYIDHFQHYSKKLWRFLKAFKGYGEKYNLTLEELLNLTHKYFEDRVDDNIKGSEALSESDEPKKGTTTEITMGLLLQAVDSLKDALRYVESALQFAHQTNNEDLIRELEDIRMHISHDDGEQIGWEGDHTHANIIGKIKDVIEKYS